MFVSVCSFLCFKQKTAYEMRISDWSSDVCSSDLLDLGVDAGRARTRGRDQAAGRNGPDRIEREHDAFFERVRSAFLARASADPERMRVLDASRPAAEEIGRAHV